MQLIEGGKNLTSRKGLADIDRGSDGIIRLTQLDYSIDEFEKIQDEVLKKKERSLNLMYQIDGLWEKLVACEEKGNVRLFNSIKKKQDKFRAKFCTLEEEIEPLEKALNQKK